MNKLTDPIQEKYEKALERSYGNVEKIIEDLLPDKAFEDMYKDLKWVHNEYVKGAKTLLYGGEPIISLFPLEINEEQTDEGYTVKLERKFIRHKEEKDEEN